MKINKIVLDLDDVLNCFTLYALQHVGCPVKPQDYEVFNPAWGFDIIQAANGLHSTETFTSESFWKQITRDVWATAPVSEIAFGILSFARRHVGAENICILTSPISDPECAAGKMEWIRDCLYKDLQRQFMIGPCKYFCARPDTLLIDDSDDNVKSFIAHGGQAILVPRPWNTNHGLDAASYLAGCFKILNDEA